MKFSELTPSDIAGLRINAALETAYPEQAEKLGTRRPSAVLAGWKTWLRARQLGLGG